MRRNSAPSCANFESLIVAPFVSAFVYVVARGRGMGDRHEAATHRVRGRTDRYLRYVASRPSSPEQIATAKELRDEGTITQAEFEELKAKALADWEGRLRYDVETGGAVSTSGTR